MNKIMQATKDMNVTVIIYFALFCFPILRVCSFRDDKREENDWETTLKNNMEALDNCAKLPSVAWPKELLYRSVCDTLLQHRI